MVEQQKPSPSKGQESSKTPLISVIIPVYNVGKLLERCVESVRSSIYDHLEIILVDDGSTDMSGKFCDIYAGMDSRIKVIHQENQGLSAARNAGLRIATGEYITFVDSDDSASEELFGHLLTLCREHNTRMSICGFREIDGTKPPKPSASENVPSENTEPADPRVDVLSTSACLTAMLCERGFSMSAWGKLYSRDLFAGISFPEGKLYEDVGTTYRAVLASDQIAVSNQELYNYYLNPGSITKQTFSLKKLDLIYLTDKMCDDILSWATLEPSDVQLEMQNLVKKRQMHARFSILRQMVMIPVPKDINERESYLRARDEVVRYLKSHKSDIIENPFATRRDKLAMHSLLLGLPVFRAAWRYYENHKNLD